MIKISPNPNQKSKLPPLEKMSSGSAWQNAAAHAEASLRSARAAVARGWRDGADGGSAALDEAQVRLDDLDALVSARKTAPVSYTQAQRTCDRLRAEWSRIVGEFNANGGHVSDSTVVAVQQTAVQQQDRQLDEIAAQLSRVGQIGSGIHEEVTLQTGLLDELQTGMEEGVRRVGEANREAGEVKDAGSTCKLWMAIIVLTIILILLIVLA